MTTPFTITCNDGRQLTAQQYLPVKPRQNKCIVINSALGVKQQFYRAFAQYLAGKGYTVITWDPRGIGLSSQADVSSDAAKLREWGQIDLEAVLNHIINEGRASWQDIILIGHSAGGHLTGLCRSITKLNHIVLISSGTCYWRLYGATQWPKMLFAWHCVFPFFAKTLGYIPKKLGVGHQLPKGIALDWRDWSLKKDYLFADQTLGELFYHQYHGKLTAIGFSDDIAFSPKQTMADLLMRFSNANKTLEIIHPKQLQQSKVGHFGFFKADNQHAWQEILIKEL